MLLPCLSLLSDQPTCDSSSHGSKCHNCSGPVCTRSTDYTNSRLSELPARVTVPWWRLSGPFRDVKFQYIYIYIQELVFLFLSKHYMIIAILDQLLSSLEKIPGHDVKNEISSCVIPYMHQ